MFSYDTCEILATYKREGSQAGLYQTYLQATLQRYSYKQAKDRCKKRQKSIEV